MQFVIRMIIVKIIVIYGQILDGYLIKWIWSYNIIYIRKITFTLVILIRKIYI